jgi:hypothetical protein
MGWGNKDGEHERSFSMGNRIKFSSLLLRLAGGICLVSFIGPAPVEAQPTRFLQAELGYDDPRNLARVLFHQEGEELCATLSIARGPEAMHKSRFLFRRLVEPKAQDVKGRLVFKFGKEPDRVEGTIQAWVACVESPPRVEEAKRDVVELTVRNANAINENLKLFVEYPAANEASGMDVLNDGANGILGKGFIRPL